MPFNLQLHADHNVDASKPFEHLGSLQDAPQIPAGYRLLVSVALVPPRWFVMDPRLPPQAAT